MVYGYARVSTDDQDTALQVDALRVSGCDEVLVETASGMRRDREVLAGLIKKLQPDDVVRVWKLDRLGRSTVHLIETVERIGKAGAAFQTLTGVQVDTQTPTGKLIFSLFAALAQYERDLIMERSAAGMKAARARGTHMGRPRAIAKDQADIIRNMVRSGTWSVAVAARTYNVSPSTIKRLLRP